MKKSRTKAQQLHFISKAIHEDMLALENAQAEVKAKSNRVTENLFKSNPAKDLISFSLTFSNIKKPIPTALILPDRTAILCSIKQKIACNIFENI